MSDAPIIFDRRLLRDRRTRFVAEIENRDVLIRHVANEITERVSIMLRPFPWALDLGAYHGLLGRMVAELPSVETVVYAESVLRSGVVGNVFLQRRIESGEVEVVVAARGEQRDSADRNTRYIVLHDGKRYLGVPGTGKFAVIEFGEHGIPYRLPAVSEAQLEASAMPTRDLLTSGDPEQVAELQWRISIPLATFILGILAVPLSRSKPRQGRYGKIAIGLLVFIIYFNLMSAGRAWLEQGAVSPALGLWWVHAAMLLFALTLIGLQNGWHRRLL